MGALYLPLIIFSVTYAYGQQNCPGGIPSTFAKIPSAVPRLSVQPVLLYATTQPGTAITAECYNRCQASNDCVGFIVDYERTSCFRVQNNGYNPQDLVPARNSNFFVKICIQVPANCTRKAWPVEYVPGTELVGFQQSTIPNVEDKWQCAQLCLTGTTQYRYGSQSPCYSAQYHAWSKTCVISGENRRTQPEAFASSSQKGVDYIENQCIADNVEAVCWHEPIYNQTIPQIDLQIPDISFEQCRVRCEQEQYFNCRGFTYRCPTGLANSDRICYLHGDDTLTTGLLQPSHCATYVERLSCIDLNVECSSTNMIVKLHQQNFNGRMFAMGHAADCGISGRNQDVTTIVLPIPLDSRLLNRCGVNIAHSMGYGNRKMVNAVVVVQRHPIIQTLGDRVVKISCIAEDGRDRLARPLTNNITLDASFYVAEPPVQATITGDYGNISSVSPTARLRIIDLSRGGSEAKEIMLGEELELRLDIFPPFNVTSVRVGHLVASSGDGRESLLLLDWRGCPPDPGTFPALVAKGSQTLSSVFKAFRFPSSPILRFSLILTICESTCQPTDCGNGLSSWGRRKRRSIITEEATKQEVPLQLAIIVRSPVQDLNNSTDFSQTSARLNIEHGENILCASWPLVMYSSIAAGVFQIFLLSSCCVLLCRGKRKSSGDKISLHNDFEQPRHVTWADQGSTW